MKINITSRHFKANDTLQEYIKGKLEDLSKYDEAILHADVILSFEDSANSVQRCEIILKLRDKTLTAKEDSDDFNKSVDMAVEKIETQVHKYKDKHKTEKYSDKDVYKTI